MAEVFKVNDQDCVKLQVRVLAHRKTETQPAFNSFQYLDKDNKFRQLKFGKNVTNVPKTNCIIVVPVAQTSVESSESSRFPSLWVKEIVSTEAIMGKAEPIDYEEVHTRKSVTDLI